mmetsp:Transcript_34897/g.45948  ORF Transcript_34897/g.45948 Transcript_34897/m.45948 type:complete len:90 (-) Transcript_34897:98-367(-)
MAEGAEVESAEEGRVEVEEIAEPVNDVQVEHRQNLALEKNISNESNAASDNCEAADLLDPIIILANKDDNLSEYSALSYDSADLHEAET